ncbi:serine/threonine protein phosphatase [Paenibacillus sp. 1011MAR3C5]|uniref:metallophosphoesterase n=1 Tax=Paenibacillus sp. 1011MAR3C5 TaxID=1675787 RepID=UPI000E6C9BB9|nr:metallophosphoesterase [Paenibacillus sp. 1011MAR3C5]RJE88938.1 serine/threonine protein phosphatase [Paenibacillus sp. 1011MAR3C5]
MNNDNKMASAKRLLAISDIHGHQDGLMRLLHEAAYDPARDQLLLLGDYIDADNPASWRTLDVVKELVSQGASAIPGNQELKLAALSKRYRGRRGLPGQQRQYVKWISSLPLCIIEAEILFVHAGLRPGIPLREQSVRDMTEIREEFFAFPLEQLAALIDGDESNRNKRLWRRIMFGHTPTSKLGAVPGDIWTDGRRIAIDTGAKHSQRLTLLDIHEGISYSCPTEPGYRSGECTKSIIKSLVGPAIN